MMDYSDLNLKYHSVIDRIEVSSGGSCTLVLSNGTEFYAKDINVAEDILKWVHKSQKEIR